MSIWAFNDRMGGDGLTLHRGRFRLDVRNSFFSKEWLGTGAGCPGMHGGEEESPSLEVFKKPMEMRH